MTVVAIGTKEVNMFGSKVCTIYAVTYDDKGWEKKTEIGTALSKGVAYIFAEAALKIYKTIRIAYHDGSNVLIGERPN